MWASCYTYTLPHAGFAFGSNIGRLPSLLQLTQCYSLIIFCMFVGHTRLVLLRLCPILITLQAMSEFSDSDLDFGPGVGTTHRGDGAKDNAVSSGVVSNVSDSDVESGVQSQAESDIDFAPCASPTPTPTLVVRRRRRPRKGQTSDTFWAYIITKEEALKDKKKEAIEGKIRELVSEEGVRRYGRGSVQVVVWAHEGRGEYDSERSCRRRIGEEERFLSIETVMQSFKR